MPSLERFFDPQIRKFDLNIKSLPGARFYFFQNGTTTHKSVFQDKAGTIAHDNPVIADSNGSFPPIFLDGLYRVELRSNANIVQPGWPIDNVGQDSAIVPFGPYSDIVSYNTGEVVTGSNGNWYRSIVNGNLGNNPISSPAEWEVIPIPVASSFTSNKAYLTWSDDGDQISLDVDVTGLSADVQSDLGLGTASVINYQTESKNLNLFGSMTGGVVTFSRIGGLITLTITTAYTHSSTSSAGVGSGYIPNDYLPSANVSVCVNVDSFVDYLQAVDVGADGSITIRYSNFSGDPVNRTNGNSFTISYNRAA